MSESSPNESLKIERRIKSSFQTKSDTNGLWELKKTFHYNLIILLETRTLSY